MGVMGRRVVVTFNNPKDAEAFIKAFKTEGAVFFQGEDGHFKNVDVATTAVEGSFAKPVDFCQCPYVKDDEYVRGSKYGLFVHRGCAKPRATHPQYPRNLLEEPIEVNGRMVQRVHLNIFEGVADRPEPKEG